MVEDAAQAVLGVVAPRRHLHRLADGNAEASGAVRGSRPGCAGPPRSRRGAGHAARAVRFHQGAAVGFLLEAHLDHVDVDLEPEQGAGETQCRAPLAGAGLGGQLGDALGLVVVSLGDGGVGLVAAGRAGALVLVVDAGRCIEDALQPPRPVQGRRAPHAVDVAHLLGDFDGALGAHLLADQGHREKRRQVLGTDGLAGAGIEHRRQGLRQVGGDVVPTLGYVAFVEQIFDGV